MSVKLSTRVELSQDKVDRILILLAREMEDTKADVEPNEDYIKELEEIYANLVTAEQFVSDVFNPGGEK